MSKPVPFSLHAPDAAIADLRERLARTRFPDQAGEPWAYGTDVAYMQELVDYWQSGFDWRAAEAKLNALPQYRLPLHGIELHFLHVPGKGPNPCPLLLSHGWPGSVLEFLEIIPRLTDPARFGGDPADAFTVVAPSLPGYGLSFAPGQKRFGVEAIADCFAELMTVLGYRRFAAQGGDWGAFVTSRLGYVHADRLIGIHLNLMPIPRDPAMLADPTPEEARYLEELKRLSQGGDRLSVDSGHAAADARFRAHRLAGRARRLDRREVPRLVGLRRRPRERVQQGPAAGQYRPLLVHRRDRLLVLALLCPHARAVACAAGGDRRRAGGLCRLPARDSAAATLARGAGLHRPSPLDRDAQGRPFRGDGAARGARRRDPRLLPAPACRGSRTAQPAR